MNTSSTPSSDQQITDPPGINNRCKPASIAKTRWIAYAAAGAATALAGSQSAEAAIHYSGPVNERFFVGSAVGFTLDQPGDSFRLSRYRASSGYYGYYGHHHHGHHRVVRTARDVLELGGVDRDERIIVGRHRGGPRGGVLPGAVLLDDYHGV